MPVSRTASSGVRAKTSSTGTNLGTTAPGAGSRPACGTPLPGAPAAGKRTPQGGTLNATPRNVTLHVLGVAANKQHEHVH